MALAQAEIEANIDAIDRAFARNERSVQFADRSTVYRSTEEMLAAREHFANLLARLLGRSRQSMGYANKGLD